MLCLLVFYEFIVTVINKHESNIIFIHHRLFITKKKKNLTHNIIVLLNSTLFTRTLYSRKPFYTVLKP